MSALSVRLKLLDKNRMKKMSDPFESMIIVIIDFNKTVIIIMLFNYSLTISYYCHFSTGKIA